MGFNVISFALDPSYRAIKRWKMAKGDERLLVDFHFAPGEIVLEGGAFRGDFTDRIAGRGEARVIAYEPVAAFRKDAVQATADRANVEIVAAGLSDRDGTATITLLGEGTSIHQPSEGKDVSGVEEIVLRRASDVVRALDGPVTLLALNVEGEEYAILDDLLAAGLAPQVRTVLVQFHLIAADSRDRYQALAERLSETHALSWRYPFVWERWDLKPA